MQTPFTCLKSDIRLRWRAAGIKLSVLLFCIGTAAVGDARQPCPALEVQQSCTAEGTARLTLRAGKTAPARVSFLVSLPAEGLPATRLSPGESLTLSLPDPKGQQVTLAVVGLEPDGAGMAGCCLSNQRVHLPSACTPVAEPTTGPDDLAIDVQVQPLCTRQRQNPVCSGEITITGASAETDMVYTTLSADLGAGLAAAGADCSPMAKGKALCHLPLGSPLPFDLTLSPNTPRGDATLCAEIGIGADATSQNLALQEALARAGYPVGVVDGRFGPATKAALGAFVDDAGLPPLADDIPPEALMLLGVTRFSDGLASNNRACAVASVPSPPLICDARTTRANGDRCACRYKSMQRISASACVCPKGQKLGAKGCARVVVEDDGPDVVTDTGPACDPATTVLRDGTCECRSASMERASETACREVEVRFCPDGSPELPDIPCPPAGPVCSRINEAGECCDALGPEDPSCR